MSYLDEESFSIKNSFYKVHGEKPYWDRGIIKHTKPHIAVNKDKIGEPTHTLFRKSPHISESK